MLLRTIRILSAMTVVSFLICCGCRPTGGTFVPPPPPDVTVSHPVRQNVTHHLEFTGTTTAIETVEVRARIQGFLQSINFKPGSKVKAGDVLFVIDPKPFQVKVAQAKADLTAKEAECKAAEDELTIKQEMFSKNAGSKLDLINSTNRRDIAKAQIDVARAALDDVQINLGYTQVIAPISGRVSRNMVDVGNLVGARDNTLLTTMVNDSSIYAYFDLSESDLLPLARKYGSRRGATGSEQEKAPAFLGLADETGYPYEGYIDFAEPQVDQNTGTQRRRAVFPNEKGLLMAGLFVRIQVPLDTADELLVPTVAIGADQSGRYVLVVNQENVVEQRLVRVGQTVDHMRVISEGLRESDWVVVNGIQRARPGFKVNPVQPGAAPDASAPKQPAKN